MCKCRAIFFSVKLAKPAHAKYRRSEEPSTVVAVVTYSNIFTIKLRPLKPSHSKTGEPETRPNHRLRLSRSYFEFRRILGVKLVFFQGGGRCSMPARHDPTGAFLGTPVLLGSMLYLTSVSHICWYCTIPLVLYHIVGTVPYCWYCTILFVVYHTVGTVPYCWNCTILFVVYHTVGTVPYSWYCAILLVLYHTVGTLPYYCTILLVLYHTVGNLPNCWYTTILLVLYHTVGTVPYCS